MNSVLPRSTYKVRAFILSFYSGGEKMDHLLWLFATWDIFFSSFFWELNTFCLKTKTQESGTTNVKSCSEQQTAAISQRHKQMKLTRAAGLRPFCQPQAFTFWQVSSLRLSRVGRSQQILILFQTMLNAKLVMRTRLHNCPWLRNRQANSPPKPIS